MAIAQTVAKHIFNYLYVKIVLKDFMEKIVRSSVGNVKLEPTATLLPDYVQMVAKTTGYLLSVQNVSPINTVLIVRKHVDIAKTASHAQQ